MQRRDVEDIVVLGVVSQEDGLLGSHPPPDVVRGKVYKRVGRVEAVSGFGTVGVGVGEESEVVARFDTGAKGGAKFEGLGWGFASGGDVKPGVEESRHGEGFGPVVFPVDAGPGGSLRVGTRLRTGGEGRREFGVVLGDVVLVPL